MKVQVLFFGATADAAGVREIAVDLPENASAENAFAQVVEQFPALKQHSLLLAVNQEYADGATKIQTGDELAIFTAVSGG